MSINPTIGAPVRGPVLIFAGCWAEPMGMEHELLFDVPEGILQCMGEVAPLVRAMIEDHMGL